MFTFLIFMAVLGVLVLVHELGHFVMAKRAGMKVEEFGFGFPPRLWGIKKGETIYSLNWIPFGGFVKILGEDGQVADNPRSFSAYGAGAKSGVLVAGVIMNILLAVFLLTIVNLWGIRIGFEGDQPLAEATEIKLQLIQIDAGSPAAKAGLEVLDEILSIRNGSESIDQPRIKQTQKFINDHRGQTVTIKLQRGQEILERSVIPRLDPPPGEGALGVSLALTGLIKYPWYQAIYRGAEQTAMLTANTFLGYGQAIKSALTKGSPGPQLSGPIGIARFTGRAAQVGFIYLLQLVALLSVNLAVLNIIPIPALDGGRLFFVLLEKIKGSALPKRAEALANSIGFSLLILLMIYVTTKDILSFFHP